MKNIKVLGSGCNKCKQTVALIEQVATEQGVAIVLEKVEQAEKIMAYGVMSTPAVVIDDVVVHKGSVPTEQLVKGWLL